MGRNGSERSPSLTFVVEELVHDFVAGVEVPQELPVGELVPVGPVVLGSFAELQAKTDLFNEAEEGLSCTPLRHLLCPASCRWRPNAGAGCNSGRCP